MQVDLKYSLSDAHLASNQASTQRQLAIALQLVGDEAGTSRSAPLNLGLVLDHSGSMSGRPLETVKQAAMRLMEQLSAGDRLTVVGFDHRAKILIPNQVVQHPAPLRAAIGQLESGGGTAIDEGMRLGIEELAKGKQDAISQMMLLTDGENEHGSNERCLKFAHLAAEHGVTINALGFGNHWNQNVLEQIADAGGGSLSYVERSDEVLAAFSRLFQRIQMIGLTNAHLLLELAPGVRLAELKPLAQVSPEVIELTPTVEDNCLTIRLGDLMLNHSRVVLVNLYVGALPPGTYGIVKLRLRYDDPSQGLTQVLSEPVIVDLMSMDPYQPAPNPEVQAHILALAKYRQTQIAETKLQLGDRAGAVTMLQTAAQTAIQLGDTKAATVLQESATRLQAGEELSEGDRKKTRIVSKTILQME